MRGRRSCQIAGVLAALFGAIVLAAASLGSTSDAEAPPRDIILISVDTLRADALGFAGNPDVKTPALDRLAAQGRVYTDAHAHNVMTLPSHANMLTGLYPYQHGVRHNGGFVLPQDIPTLATILKDAGYTTAAFLAAFPLDARFGLARGFDVYDDDFGTPEGGAGGEPLFTYAERPGSEVVAKARAWWRENDGRRRFVFLHLFDPHAPYAAPEPFGSRFQERPYLGEVAAVDAFLSPFLEGFLSGREAPAMIAFTSDHGESLGAHGELTHGLFAYEPTLKVPLVLWAPGLVEPGRTALPAGHVDLVPTLLDAASVAPPPALPGRSLLDAALEPPEDGYYFEALSANLDLDWAPLRGVLSGGKKYIDLPLRELYDLQRDPRESDNLFRKKGSEAAALHRLLPEESVWPPETGDVSPEEAAKLRSLGYLGGGGTGASRKTSFTAADDPKNLVAVDRKINRVMELSAQARYREAVALGQEILAERSSLAAVYTYVAGAQLKLGAYREALELMERARRGGWASAELLRLYGLTLVEAGQPRRAYEVLAPLARDPADHVARNHLSVALAALGRHREAMALLRDVLSADPRNVRAWENLSFLALEKESYGDARDFARKALELRPGLANAWNNLGVAHYHLGQKERAVDAWRRAIHLAPGDLRTLFNLGLAEAESGDSAAALKTLRRFLESAPSPHFDQEKEKARELLLELGP